MLDITIFDILNTTIPNSNITFHNGRFYAYKNLLIDLHNELTLNLSKPTKNNTLLNQLNINIDKDPHIIRWIDTINTKYYHGIRFIIHHELTIDYYEKENQIYIIHLKPVPNSPNHRVIGKYNITTK